MHERIKKLAEKAGLEALYIYESHPDFPKETFPAGFYTETKNRIFAELIVKECIDKIETYQIPVGNSAAGEMASEWTHDALIEIRDDIKQHFGIK